jgi:DNA polymerase I
MSKYVFDIESDGLLDTISKVWMIVAIDITTKEKHIFTDYNKKYKSIKDGLSLLYNAEMIIGHNIIGYDLIALRKIYNWAPSESTKVVDTMLMSQVLDYNRFNGKHSLEMWGNYFGKKKIEHEDWSQYSEEMLIRCIVDTEINVMVYSKLIGELKEFKKPDTIKLSLANEHATAMFCADAEYYGWLFDKEAAINLLNQMEEQLSSIEKVIQPNIKQKTKAVDKEPKNPKWIKNGNYDKFTANWFNIDPEDGKENRTILGPYTRVEIVNPDLGNLDSVKLYLKSLGWEPDDWNWKKVNGNLIKMSEKLTTSSLEKLGEIGLLIDKYYTTRSRHSILKGWLENLDKDNRLHGSCFTISTPTGRARHSGIVNVPSADSEWGPEIRGLFIASPGYKIVGADSSGNQMRSFLHYLKNDEYTNLVLNGDVHSKNAELLQEVTKKEVIRGTAKKFLYAFLFGAGDEKAALTVVGMRDKKLGKEIRDKFTKSTPGLHELISKLQRIYHKTMNMGKAYIPCIDGRRIYVDSAHKALNYLLQSMEAVTCKGAIAYAAKRLKEEQIPYRPLIWMHDEIQIETPDEFAKKAAEICKEAFKEAPKMFGVMIMDGESKIGNNWYETH